MQTHGTKITGADSAISQCATLTSWRQRYTLVLSLFCQGLTMAIYWLNGSVIERRHFRFGWYYGQQPTGAARYLD
jgi:hypothetical protein